MSEEAQDGKIAEFVKVRDLFKEGSEFLQNLPGCERYAKLLGVACTMAEKLSGITDALEKNDRGELLVSFGDGDKFEMTEAYWNRAVVCTNLVSDLRDISAKALEDLNPWFKTIPEKVRLAKLAEKCGYVNRIRCCGNCKFLDEEDGDFTTKPFCGNPKNETPDGLTPDGERCVFDIDGCEGCCKNHRFKDEPDDANTDGEVSK